MIIRIQALELSFKELPRFSPHVKRTKLKRSHESVKTFAEVLNESIEALKRQNQ